MSLNVFSRPTEVFTRAFDEPRVGSAWAVVIVAGLLFSLAVFLATGNTLQTGAAFVFNLVQFLVLSVVVWFLEFVHVRKRKRMTGTNFSHILSVVGKLWVINLVGYLVLAIVALLLLIAAGPVIFAATIIFTILTIVIVIAWIVASFKMLKVVSGTQRGKLIVNWIILVILNGLITGFIMLVLSRLLI